MAQATPASLHAIVSAQADRDPSLFDSLGLMTVDPPRPSGYDQTPRNALTFAWTGGDGVHFSLLQTGDPDLAPVVMTVPMNVEEPNFVVGCDLDEFLALGLRTGYFTLEGLAYDPAPTIARLDAGTFPADMAAPVKRTLRAIESAFALSPWTGHAARLAELKTQFAALIET